MNIHISLLTCLLMNDGLRANLCITFMDLSSHIVLLYVGKINLQKNEFIAIIAETNSPA